MRIAIDLDNFGNLESEYFDKSLLEWKEIADIKLVCRGLKNRVGDKYDKFRGRADVLFTEGMPLHLFYSSIGWWPDLTYISPKDSENSIYLNSPEVLI